MANTPATSPGTMASVDFGALAAWDTPDNAKVSDDVYTTTFSTTSGGSATDYLEATNFGFSIPAGATINGILVEVEKKASHDEVNFTVQDYIVKLLKGGVVTGDRKEIGGTWSLTESYYTYGGNSDLWGTTWTPAEINASDFGLSFLGWISTTGAAVTASVDHIRITIYYTEEVGFSIAFI